MRRRDTHQNNKVLTNLSLAILIVCMRISPLDETYMKRDLECSCRALHQSLLLAPMRDIWISISEVARCAALPKTTQHDLSENPNNSVCFYLSPWTLLSIPWTYQRLPAWSPLVFCPCLLRLRWTDPVVPWQHCGWSGSACPLWGSGSSGLGWRRRQRCPEQLKFRGRFQPWMARGAVFRTRIRIGSVFNQLSGSVFGIQIRIQEGKNDPQK